MRVGEEGLRKGICEGVDVVCVGGCVWVECSGRCGCGLVFIAEEERVVYDFVHG